MSINSELVLPYTILSLTYSPLPTNQPTTFHSQATRLQMSASCDTRPTKSTSQHWVWYCLCFHFSVLLNRIHAVLLYLFVFPSTISYLHSSFAYSYTHLFPPFIRQLFIAFSLYAFRCFVLHFLLIQTVGLAIKIQTHRRVQLPTKMQTKHDDIKSEVFIAVRIRVLVWHRTVSFVGTNITPYSRSS